MSPSWSLGKEEDGEEEEEEGEEVVSDRRGREKRTVALSMGLRREHPKRN